MAARLLTIAAFALALVVAPVPSAFAHETAKDTPNNS